MTARHVCATLGVAVAVGAVVFIQSLVTTNDAQAVKVAERLLRELPVEKGAETVRLQLDFRPDGHVLQGPPMMAFAATRKGLKGALVTKALFAQRRVKNLPPVGEDLTLVGRKGAYRVVIEGYLDWEKPMRGYPNVFLPPESVNEIDEEWKEFEPRSAEELAPMFRSDASVHMSRAKPLLLGAAALTALCLLLNSLFLSIESRRREIATLRMIGLTRSGVAKLVFSEAMILGAAGAALGLALAVGGLELYVRTDSASFPMGAAFAGRDIVSTLVVAMAVAAVGTLLALRPAFAVKPLEAASAQAPKRRPVGMLIAFTCGFGAFVAVEVWGASLMKPFVPSPEWPDAIVSILPGGVSSFDIERLQKLPGVRRIAELQPLQVNFEPLVEQKAFKRGFGPPMKTYRNGLLLASDWLPDFRFVAGERAAAEKAMREGDACIITEMMARARQLKLGDDIKLNAGRGLIVSLKIVGIIDLNWHMVTSRGLVRGLNRMPNNTDGPVFVSFDTLAACDPRPQEFVRMTHLWLNYEPKFLAEHGVFPAGRIVEREIVEALDGAWAEGKDGEVRGNTVRLHARDEISDGTLAHGTDIIGAMSRVPFVFLAILSFGFVAMLVASVEARRREFVVLRTIGATRAHLAWILCGEALKVAGLGIVIGIVGGATVGWLCTSGTRAAMATWGLPACFVFPVATCLKGALGAIVFTLVVSVPASFRLVRHNVPV